MTIYVIPKNFQVSFLIYTLNISISWMKCLFIYTEVPIDIDWQQILDKNRKIE